MPCSFGTRSVFVLWQFLEENPRNWDDAILEMHNTLEFRCERRISNWSTLIVWAVEFRIGGSIALPVLEPAVGWAVGLHNPPLKVRISSPGPIRISSRALSCKGVIIFNQRSTLQSVGFKLKAASISFYNYALILTPRVHSLFAQFEYGMALLNYVVHLFSNLLGTHKALQRTC
jgi:hypothetical protein